MRRANRYHLAAWTAMLAISGAGTLNAQAATNSRPVTNPRPVSNQWKSIGPQGGEAQSLSLDPHHPGTLYAATSYGGAFNSLDGGARWVKSAAPNTPLIFDPQDPYTIYAIDDVKGISKSTDGGTSWNPVNSGLPLCTGCSPARSVTVIALAIDPLNSSTLYTATSEGIVKSTDGGASWSSASSGLPVITPGPPNLLPGKPHYVGIYSVVVDPQNPSTVYAASSGLAVSSGTGLTVYARGGLFKSTDGGASWNLAGSGLPESLQLGGRMILAIDPQNPGKLYAGTPYGVFKSTDAGADWSPVNSGMPPFQTEAPQFSNGPSDFHADLIVIDPQQPDTVYAAISNALGSRVSKTTNGGASWSDAGSGLPDGTVVRSLQLDPLIPATLYAATTAGVYKSTDGGTSWGAANSGLIATLISDVAIDPRNSSTLYATTTSGLAKTTDGGRTWSPPKSGVASWSYVLAIDPQNTGTLFTTGCDPAENGVSNCGVVKSTDGGTSWRLSWSAQDSSVLYSDWITALAIDPKNSNIIYATTQGFDECDFETLRKSVDGGMTWSETRFKDMGVSASCVLDLAVDPQNSGNLYAAFQYGGVYKSTDEGATWNAANSGLPPRGAYFPPYSAVALAIDPGSSRTVYVVSFSGVFKSTDGGSSWNSASSGLPDWSSELGDCCFRPRVAVDPQNSARVYLGIAKDGVHLYQSPDGGASWTDSGLAVSGGSLWFGGLAISPQGTVYAGSPSAGVFALSNAARLPPDPHTPLRDRQ